MSKPSVSIIVINVFGDDVDGKFVKTLDLCLFSAVYKIIASIH